MNKAKNKIAIVAGGTGGHIYPALIVAKALKDKGFNLVWLGEPDSLESQIAKENKIDFIALSVKKIRGQSLSKKIYHCFYLIYCLFQCFFLLKSESIEKMVVFGGYVSFPFALIGKIKKVSLYIHEQNTIAGLTNRILAPLASKIFLGFAQSIKRKNSLYTGNPIRESILKIKKNYQNFDPQKKIKILIFGGSLGSEVFNQKLPQIISQLAKNYPLEVLHQYGKLKQKPDYSFKVQTTTYIKDMAKAYDWADFVICRSGAISVSETDAIGIFTLYIPYPYAVDNHQYFNAKAVLDCHLKHLLLEEQLEQKNFKKIFDQLLQIKQFKDQKTTKKDFYTQTTDLIIKQLN